MTHAQSFAPLPLPGARRTRLLVAGEARRQFAAMSPTQRVRRAARVGQVLVAHTRTGPLLTLTPRLQLAVRCLEAPVADPDVLFDHGRERRDDPRLIAAPFA